MADELDAVKKELTSISNRLRNENPQARVRFAVVFYRDIEDRELVRSWDFSTDAGGKQILFISIYLDYISNFYDLLAVALSRLIGSARAEGGGDWEEHIGAVCVMFIPCTITKK